MWPHEIMGKNLHHINLAPSSSPTEIILTYIQLSIAELNWASSSSNLFPRVKGSKIHGVSWTWRMACFFHTFCGYFRFTQAEQQHSSKISILLHIGLDVSKVFVAWINVPTCFLCYKNNEKRNSSCTSGTKKLKFMALFWCIMCFSTKNGSYIEKAGRKYFVISMNVSN